MDEQPGDEAGSATFLLKVNEAAHENEGYTNPGQGHHGSMA